jgi:hypothetical protein
LQSLAIRAAYALDPRVDVARLDALLGDLEPPLDRLGQDPVQPDEVDRDDRDHPDRQRGQEGPRVEKLPEVVEPERNRHAQPDGPRQPEHRLVAAHASTASIAQRSHFGRSRVRSGSTRSARNRQMKFMA